MFIFTFTVVGCWCLTSIGISESPLRSLSIIASGVVDTSCLSPITKRYLSEIVESANLLSTRVVLRSEGNNLTITSMRVVFLSLVHPKGTGLDLCEFLADTT